MMPMVWLIPIAVLVLGAGAVIRLRRRSADPKLTSEPLSGQWLADVRAKEEHWW
jgi:hypothetical protein